jgi:hypothetical protein
MLTPFGHNIIKNNLNVNVVVFIDTSINLCVSTFIDLESLSICTLDVIFLSNFSFD